MCWDHPRSCSSLPRTTPRRLPGSIRRAFASSYCRRSRYIGGSSPFPVFDWNKQTAPSAWRPSRTPRRLRQHTRNRTSQLFGDSSHPLRCWDLSYCFSRAFHLAPLRAGDRYWMEIITGVERRRRRPENELRMPAEPDAPAVKFINVARRHDPSRDRLWQRPNTQRGGKLEAEGAPIFIPSMSSRRCPDRRRRPTRQIQQMPYRIGTRLVTGVSKSRYLTAPCCASRPAAGRGSAAARP